MIDSDQPYMPSRVRHIAIAVLVLQETILAGALQVGWPPI